MKDWVPASKVKDITFATAAPAGPPPLPTCEAIPDEGETKGNSQQGSHHQPNQLLNVLTGRAASCVLLLLGGPFGYAISYFLQPGILRFFTPIGSYFEYARMVLTAVPMAKGGTELARSICITAWFGVAIGVAIMGVLLLVSSRWTQSSSAGTHPTVNPKKQRQLTILASVLAAVCVCAIGITALVNSNSGRPSTASREAQIAKEETQTRRHIQECRWWSKKPSDAELDGLIERIVSTNSGNWVIIDDLGQSEVVSTSRGGEWWEVSSHSLRRRKCCVTVSGSRRTTNEDAIVKLQEAVDRAEFKNGPAPERVPVSEIKWQRFVHPKGLASIDMPGVATIDDSHKAIATFSFRDVSIVYELKVTPLSEFLQQAPVAKSDALENASYAFRKSLVRRNLSAVFISEEVVQLGETRGKELRTHADFGIRFSRIYVHRGHVIEVEITFPFEAELTKQEMGRFFDSLKLNNDAQAVGGAAPMPNALKAKDAVADVVNDVNDVNPMPKAAKEIEAEPKSHWKRFSFADVEKSLSRDVQGSRLSSNAEYGTTAILTIDGRDILTIPHDGKWSAVAFDVSCRSQISSLFCTVNGVGMNFKDHIPVGKWTPVVVVYSQPANKMVCLVDGKTIVTAPVTSSGMTDQLRLKIGSRTHLKTTLNLRKLRVWADGTPPAELIELAALNVIPVPTPLVAENPVAAEPLPDDFRTYFERADATHVELVASSEKKIADLEKSVGSDDTLPADKKRMSVELTQAKAKLTQLKLTTPFAYLRRQPAIGDLATLRSGSGSV